MSRQTFRARIRDGRIEPLDVVTLPEGREIRVTFELVPELPGPARPPVVFASWDLGTFQPLTRGDVDDDAD